MKTARLFHSGGDQAVRLPNEFRFNGTEVALKRIGTGVLLLPLDEPWAIMEAALEQFEPGFKLVREEQPPEPQREALSAPKNAS